MYLFITDYFIYWQMYMLYCIRSIKMKRGLGINAAHRRQDIRYILDPATQ